MSVGGTVLRIVTPTGPTPHPVDDIVPSFLNFRPLDPPPGGAPHPSLKKTSASLKRIG